MSITHGVRGRTDRAPRGPVGPSEYAAPAADLFYNELTVEKSVPGSYFMACGFRHGYFGIQEQANGRKVVIFSVWDPGHGDNPNQVPEKDRVEVLYHAPDVLARRFGGEGTGGQSFFEYSWKVGQTYRFLVKAVTADNKTSFSGYFWLPEKKAWKHLVTFRTITGGTRLESPHSFIEDFRRDGKSATRDPPCGLRQRLGRRCARAIGRRLKRPASPLRAHRGRPRTPSMPGR